jgi:hypothetical protein
LGFHFCSADWGMMVRNRNPGRPKFAGRFRQWKFAKLFRSLR